MKGWLDLPVIKCHIHAASDVPVTLETLIKISDIKKTTRWDLTFIRGAIYTARDKAHVKNSTKADSSAVQFRRRLHVSLCLSNNTIKWKIQSFTAGPTTTWSASCNRKMYTARPSSWSYKMALPAPCIHMCTGALAQRAIVDVLQIHHPELGETEPVWKLKVENFGPQSRDRFVPT